MKRIVLVPLLSVLLSTISFSAEPSSAPRAFLDGEGPGWRALGPNDFKPVNSAPETLTWRADGLHCTGQPISVLSTAKEFVNFEMIVEWKHLRVAGNSGIFVWATHASIEKLAAVGGPGLPDGIEVQILDHGFADGYKMRNPGKPSDWFTTNGDVFAVRAKLKPFPPLSPNGSRSFPRRQLSHGAGEWNHYYTRAINGEIRLWVNGEEVSGGAGAVPARGFLCLESEGSPIHFRALRIRELP